MAEEIDRTANQLRRQRERAAAAALDASRFDPPERDQSSPRKQQPLQVDGASSNLHVTFSDPTAERGDSASGEEDTHNLSIQERIALLNQQAPKRGSLDVVGRGAAEDGRAPSPSRAGGRVGRVSVPSPVPGTELPGSLSSHSPLEQRVSPRSQSDTGLGSDTDTDSDVRYHGQHAGEGGAVRGDRSRLSLHLNNSVSPQPASSAGEGE